MTDHAQRPLQDMARLSASEVACYRWPEDTAEHRAMRAAFCDGAAHTITSTDRAPLPNGWKLVPIELTDSMRWAGGSALHDEGEDTEGIWRAILKEVPDPPSIVTSTNHSPTENTGE